MLSVCFYLKLSVLQFLPHLECPFMVLMMTIFLFSGEMFDIECFTRENVVQTPKNPKNVSSEEKSGRLPPTNDILKGLTCTNISRCICNCIYTFISSIII